MAAQTRRRPRGWAPSDVIQNDQPPQQISRHQRTSHHLTVCQAASLGLLLEALTVARHPGHPLALVRDDEGVTRFPCPRRCCRLGRNGGPVTVVNGDRWRCWSCLTSGTRWSVITRVLGDPVALEYLLAVVDDD